MNGFVTRLLNVTYGMTPSARPLIAPRFAPGADVPGTRPNYVESAVEEQGSEQQMIRGQETGLPAADVPGAERGGHRGPPVQAFGSLSLQRVRRASESPEIRGLSPTFRSGMPGQSGVSDEPRNATALSGKTEETSEQRAPGPATQVVNSAAVTEQPASGAEQSNSITVALRTKHVPVHHHLSETSETGQAARGKFTPHSDDRADGATVMATSRREATEVSIVSASDEAEGALSGSEGTKSGRDRGRSLASRWMESQREADTRTVDISAPFVGNRPYPHTKQAARGESNPPEVPAAPIVRVTIGRIEVRAISQPPPPPRPARPAAPRLSLDEYLASQAGRNR
jgi:hypothetical protein